MIERRASGGGDGTGPTWRRRWQRAQALGPAYFQVVVRWIGWALALVITLVGGAPDLNRATAGPFLVLTFLQTALFTIYYPLLHHRLRGSFRRFGLHRRQGSVAWAGVDLLLSMAAVAGTGGFRSPFFQYALTSVMFPSLVFRWRGALVAGPCSTCCTCWRCCSRAMAWPPARGSPGR